MPGPRREEGDEPAGHLLHGPEAGLLAAQRVQSERDRPLLL